MPIDNKKIRRKIQKYLRDRMKLAGEFIEGAAKLRAPADTGRLRASIQNRVVRYNVARVGTSVEYAAQKEFGGPITPKGKPFGADYLTIPLNKEAERSNATDFPDLFVFETDDGKKFLVRDRGGELEFMYRLTKRVVQEAQPFLRPAIYNNKRKIFKILGAGKLK